MRTIAEWAGSVGQRLRGAEDREKTRSDRETTRRGESRSSLFHCPDCETVYIAVGKTTCLTCETTVVKIPSTPAETA